MTPMMTFHLMREVDDSGVSGTGIVAHGCIFPDGSVALRWDTPHAPKSTAVYSSIDDVITIHCHNGHSRLVGLG